MKVVGKKDLQLGRNIFKMLIIYILILLIVSTFLITYYKVIVLWSTVLALTVLTIERIVAYVKFKKLPFDLITMHRDHIEVKLSYGVKDIKYKNIKSIDLSNKLNRFFIVTDYNTRIYVKYLDNAPAVRKEILDYKEKYYK